MLPAMGEMAMQSAAGGSDMWRDGRRAGLSGAGHRTSSRRQILSRSTALTGAFALIAVGAGTAANARNECGSPDAGTVTCTSAGNSYANGVTYAPVADLTVVLNPDVVVNSTVSVTGAGNLNVQNGGTVATSGTGATGLLVSSTSSGTAIANAGSIATSGDMSPGIYANAAAGVTISGIGSINTAGNGSPGVSVITPVTASGAISVTTGSVATTGPNSAGFYVSTYGGPASVSATLVKASGDFSPGVFVGATGSININVGQVSTAGASTADGALGPNDATGIFAISTGGDVNITAGSISTASDLSRGVFAYTPTGAVNISTGSITTTGLAAIGIQAIAAGTGVNITSGSISTLGDQAVGILTYGSAPISIISTGTLSTQGASADGVYAQTSATVSVVNTGAISVQGATSRGIYASGAAGVTISGTGSVSTAGVTSPAIAAISSGGAVSIAMGAVATTGDSSDGVDATGAGPVSVSTAAIQTSGNASIGVNVNSTGDAVNVLVGGAVVSALGDAVDVTSATGSTITVGAKGSLAAPGGYAVQGFAGPVAISNAGTITGRILLAGSGDSVANTGLFVATGDSNFGTGGDVFSNSSVLQIAPTGGQAGSVSFNGLQAFNNTGLVELRNGHAGDVLTLTGAFDGASGSRLGLDVQLGGAGSTADKLVVGTITGTTSLLIQDVGASVGALNKGIVVVQAAPGSAAGALTLANGPISKGFIQYSLVSNSASGTYSLVGLPGAPAYQTLKFTEGAENLWHASEAAWSSHLTGLRDAASAGDRLALAPGGRGWAEVFGSDLQRNGAQDFTTFGQGQRFDLSYDQSYVGFQGGFDVVRAALGGAIAYGLTGGYANSRLHFRAAAGAVDYDVGNVGLYAAYVAGPAFVNLLFKYDHDELSASSPIARYKADPNADGYGGAAEAGYRLGGSRLWAEPVASLEYVRTNLDSFAAQGASFQFDGADSLLGKVGLRVGGALRLASGVLLSPYGGAHLVKEFDGDNRVAFTSGGYTVAFANRRPGGFGQAEAGLDIATPGRLSGFIEGDGDFGGGVSGGGGRVGLRFRW